MVFLILSLMAAVLAVVVIFLVFQKLGAEALGQFAGLRLPADNQDSGLALNALQRRQHILQHGLEQRPPLGLGKAAGQALLGLIKVLDRQNDPHGGSGSGPVASFVSSHIGQ